MDILTAVFPVLPMVIPTVMKKVPIPTVTHMEVPMVILMGFQIQLLSTFELR